MFQSMKGIENKAFLYPKVYAMKKGNTFNLFDFLLNFQKNMPQVLKHL